MNTYYNYSTESLIAVDIETKDPFLKEKGNGVFRKDGHILGVAFSNGDLAEYYPLNHFDTTAEEKELNIKYITEQLRSSNSKVFARAIYDLDWLTNFNNFEVNGKIHDIQVAEPLLDEYKISYSLDNLAKDYLQIEKYKSEIDKYCEQENWPTSKSKDSRSYLWKMPQDIVKLYGATDAKLTQQIIGKQLKELEAQYLLPVYDLEIRLIPLLLQMRRQGVRLNKDQLYKVGLSLSDMQYTLQEELNRLTDSDINVNSNRDLERLFKKLNLPITYNEPTERMILNDVYEGNPKFDKATLQSIDSPIAIKILEIRHIKTLLSLFIIPYPDMLVNDRLHCNFNQLKSDDYGTVTGRFSSSNPNLQQVSAKEEESILTHSSEILNGLIIRKLFIPEEDCDWLKLDWSQIEYRFLAHYAMGNGSDEIRKRYNDNPNTDYHSELGDMVGMPGIENRKPIKNLNFGTAYGMGVDTMAKKFGWSIEEARAIYTLYHKKVPFVKETSNRVGLKAKRIGFIKTILGRRARLKSPSKAYVMLNRLLQGSAADLMKKAMVEAFEAGIYNVLHPHLTVHDENDQSMPRTKEGYDAANDLKNIMEKCIELKVPIKVDMEVGSNWGDLKKVEKLKWSE